MNKIQVRLVDPAFGKVITKTFEGADALAQAQAFLARLAAQ